ALQLRHSLIGLAFPERTHRRGIGLPGFFRRANVKFGQVYQSRRFRRRFPERLQKNWNVIYAELFECNAGGVERASIAEHRHLVFSVWPQTFEPGDQKLSL